MVKVVTEEDFQVLNDKLDRVLEQLDQIKHKESRLLTAQDMLVKLNVGYRTFQRRIPHMRKYGLKKIGGVWQMKETDFLTYIDSL